MSKITSVSLEDGKYELRHDEAAGTLQAYRYGEFWQDFTGNKFVYLLMQKALAEPVQEPEQPICTVIAASDFEGRVQWQRAGRQPQLGAALYASPQAQAVPPVWRVLPGFRWDGNAQQHIPQLMVEFEPVRANSPNDAPGWQRRDQLAKMLAARSQAEQAQGGEG